MYTPPAPQATRDEIKNADDSRLDDLFKIALSRIRRYPSGKNNQALMLIKSEITNRRKMK